MKNITPQLAALFANESINVCRLWTITLSNGAVFRFTDLNSNLLFQGDVYVSEPGITISAVQTSLNSEPADATVNFSTRNDFISKNGMRRGSLDRASIEIVAVDYFNLNFGAVPLLTGVVANSGVTDAGAASLEVRGALYSTERTFIERYSERCRNEFGDDKCGVDVESLGVAFTVEEIGARFAWIGSTDLDQVEDFFNMGKVRFTSGANENIEYEIGKFARSPDEVTGRAALLIRPQFDIELGDEAIIFPGCNKQVKSDCLRRYDNVKNFRGEPFVPNVTFDAAINNLAGPDGNDAPLQIVDVVPLQTSVVNLDMLGF